MENLLFILLIFSIIWYWWDTQQSNEIALAVCKQKCINAGLQLLDATVTRQRTWLRRNTDSRVQICRLYSFEYIDDSPDEFTQSTFGEREHGYIVLIGKQAVETNMSHHASDSSTKSEGRQIH